MFLLASLIGAACSDDPSTPMNSSGLATGGATANGSSTMGVDSETSSGGADGVSWGQVSDSSSGGSSTGDSADATGDGGESESGSETESESSSSTGDRPVDNTFGPCQNPTDCPTGVCLQFVQQGTMNFVGGHCSVTPCDDPILDCGVPPTGEATPACMPVSLNGELTSVCALDCGGGASCPDGLNCRDDVLVSIDNVCV